MPPADPAREVQQLLAQQDFTQALAAAERWVQRQPGVFTAWMSLARAALGLGLLGRADEAITRAFAMAPKDAQASFFRAVIDHRIGRSDAAIERLTPLARGSGPMAIDAALALAEALHRTARHDALQALVDAGGAWMQDERAILYAARTLGRNDPAAATALLERFARGTGPAWLRRFAGFDAVRMLDAAGRFREAFDLATHLHATTGAPFDVAGLAREVERQRTLLAKGAAWCPPRAPRLSNHALVISLPRSGTTLLEQMLDRHPQVTGIGEYDGVLNLGDDLVSTGLWPDGLASLDPMQATAFQQRYVQGARTLLRPGTTHAFDKMLVTWQWLPAVACVLPGAVGLHMARDPRDTAVSLYLSNFHPISMGWTASLEGIRRVIAAERSLLPQALETLGIPHETVVYENLVADPAATVERCLRRMGLPMHPAVLEPERNTRTVHTLSHDQVRKPIHAGSIGRWRNYAWAFDDAWKPLVDLHDRRRADGR
jgi:tetratricopeptide (TPR) repeat protein